MPKIDGSMNEVISFNLPTIEEDEIAEVVATLRSGWLTTGPRTAQFEGNWRTTPLLQSRLIRRRLTSSGLGRSGNWSRDEVITTPLTLARPP
jgi:dTDP-4-amino-4,6-dideoxygalactose transaminase